MPGASSITLYLLMFLAGALATLGFAPFEWPAFTLISVASAYLIIEHPKIARLSVWRLGWTYGAGFFGASVSWVYVSIHQHGGMHAIPAALLTLLFCAGLGLLFALQFGLYRRLFSRANPIAFAAIWIGFEWLRSWLLTGFPWMLLGYAWIDTPIAKLAPIGGVWLVSSVAVTLGLLIAIAVQHRRTIWLGAAISLFLLPNLIALQPIDTSDRRIDIALIQPNIEQSLKWQQAFFEEHITQLAELSLEAENAQWIIWPETAVPRLINRAFETLGPWINQFDSRNQILVSGFPRREWDDSQERWIYLNSLGTLTGYPSLYDKQRLVPFGEYIPLESWLRGLISFFDLPMSSFSLPDKPAANLQIGDQAVAPAICYEIAYPELVREGIQRGAGLILTLSNDTWFSGSHAPAQHMQIARMRALENHRWLIRATNNGQTAVVDPWGEITASIPSYQSGVLNTSVWPSYETTVYQRFGVAPVLAFWAALLILSLINSRRQRSLKH